MNYILDTSMCIALLNNNPSGIRERLKIALNESSRVLISAVSLHELWYGVAKASQAEQRTFQHHVQNLLAGSIELLPFDEDDAYITGFIRAEAEKIGMQLGAYDLQVAGQAVSRKFTLITVNNPGYFAIETLLCEDWSLSK